MTDPARHPKGIPTGGQFAPDSHAEPALALAATRGYDPEDVALGILEDLRKLPVEWTRELYYGTHKAVQDGETTYEEFLDGLIAKNHGGRCKRHEYDRFDTERYCNDCLTSLMVEARTNDKPLPTPRGVIPVPQGDHHLEKTALGYESGDNSSRETSALTGDEQFEIAVRRLFKAPADATVEVIMEENEDWSTYTGESSTEITVKCDGREATYSYMGSFMRALDQAEQNPQGMALRFMRADSAERPLLDGIAAVYLRNGDYGTPKPVFGKIRNVFPGGNDPSMDFLHTDGRQEYLRFSQVVSILETDQSSEYNENRQPLPATSAGLSHIISKTIDDSGERVVRAMIPSPGLEAQLRSYLRVDEAAAPVKLHCETVDFYGVEQQSYTVTCNGKETSFPTLDRLLADVAN